MKSKRLLCLVSAVALIGLMLTGCDNERNKKMEMSVRIINIPQVFVQSGIAEQESAHVKAVKEKLEAGLTLAKSGYETMEPTLRSEAERADSQLLEIQWKAEQQAARKITGQAIKAAVREWQEKHEVDLVLSSENTLSYSEKADISKEIVDMLKEKTLVFGKLPEISLRSDTVADNAHAEGK